MLHRVLAGELGRVAHPASVRVARPYVEPHLEDARVEGDLECRHPFVRAVVESKIGSATLGDRRRLDRQCHDPLLSTDGEHLLVQRAQQLRLHARLAQIGHPVECERGHRRRREADEKVGPAAELAQLGGQRIALWHEHALGLGDDLFRRGGRRRLLGCSRPLRRCGWPLCRCDWPLGQRRGHGRRQLLITFELGPALLPRGRQGAPRFAHDDTVRLSHLGARPGWRRLLW
mmetsp:Transcript_58817/g.174791  ORF Transcript_58817/g.174791 Transcript_58817/m.174791 type:complete len:231 (-) Transcript_58817:257-949(-)